MIDFDHESAGHASNWPDEFRQLREQCPRAWTENHGGFWLATRYNDVVKIAQAPESFSSGKVFDEVTGEPSGGIGIPVSALPALIPDEVDNPEWQGYRQFVNRHFAPKAAEARRTFIRGVARTLVDDVIERGSFDIVEDLANPLPAITTMDLFGLGLEDWRAFSDPIHTFVYTQRSDPAFPGILEGVNQICERIESGAAERRLAPRDDLLSFIANGQIDGRLLNDEEVRQLSLNIIFGGVDTTTALTAHALKYLSDNPADRQRLIDDPSLIPRAREEFVRYFAPVHGLSRNATHDVEMDGWKFQKGDRVLLSYASANRDEEIFDDPEQIQLDRFPNRHIGFGAGMHRCLGSFFARVMFESMLEEVLLRMPDYRVLDDRAVSYPSIANVNGWITMPASFTPGPKLGGGVAL